MAQVLVENGADTEAKDQYGATALIIASADGHRGVVEALLKAKAEIGAEDRNGWTPLLWATSAGNAAVVELLRQKAQNDADSLTNAAPTM